MPLGVGVEVGVGVVQWGGFRSLLLSPAEVKLLPPPRLLLLLLLLPALPFHQPVNSGLEARTRMVSPWAPFLAFP